MKPPEAESSGSGSDQKRRKRELTAILIISVLIIVLTTVMVRLSKTGSELPVSVNILFFGLININVVLILLLIFLSLRNFVKLFVERRQALFGSKLRTKLVVAFVSFSILPTLLLFYVSGLFIVQSIERWFSIQVRSALEESLAVAQTYYQSSALNAIYYARQISSAIHENKLLNQQNLDELEAFIREKQTEYNLSAVKVFSATLEELCHAINPEIPYSVFPPPDSAMMKRGLEGKEESKIESAGEGDEGEIIGGIVSIRSTYDPAVVVGVVMVNYYLPKSLVGKMTVIAESFEKYNKSEILKKQLKLQYLQYLLLIAMLIVFSATWLGFKIARGITIPIQRLAEGTHEVAQGNLDYRIEVMADDEIGTLVNSFNQMTADIQASRREVNQASRELRASNVELEQRRRYMEIVLRDVAAGVVSADAEGRVTTVNRSAERMFGVEAEAILGKHYRELLGERELEIVEDFYKSLKYAGDGSVDRQVEVEVQGRTLTMLVNMTVLKDEEDQSLGMVVVFDDLTELIKAQRAAAWREVARRIAHEIKNPLTPIQLSAQRLKKRYARLADDGSVFEECTDMIIKQVDAMKHLVNEFSSFARMPAADPTLNDLNEIIDEALVLYQEGHKNIAFRFQKDICLPQFKLDRDQIKRTVINLLDNAVAAVDGEGEIMVETAYNAPLQFARIEVRDNGPGIAPEDKDRLFEPYFSTKKAGTGLGLTIVRSIISDHNGYIRVQDNEPRGTTFIIEMPVRV